MGRPRRQLGVYNPALRNQAAVTLVDMGGQPIDQTMVANTGFNTILNSIRTTDVYFHLYPTGGQSFNIVATEMTNPTQSALYIVLKSNTGIGEAGLAVRMKGFFMQGS